MSADDDDQGPADYAVGRGRPPTEHQFKGGKSGNSKGRPKKRKRLYAPRQVRRDILSVTEAATTLRTPEGEITVPTFVAVLLVARKKALSGHGPSIRLIMDRHNQAISDHWRLDEAAPDFPTKLEEEVPFARRQEDDREIERKAKRQRRRS